MRLLLLLLPLLLLPACGGCTERVSPGDEGEGEFFEGEGEEGEGEGEGEGEEGEGEEGEGEEGEGEDVVDGGIGFDLDSLRDGGVLDCLPESLPELSVGGALDALGLEVYQGGGRENGVVCGDVTCDDDVPCCALCGFGACAAPLDGGVPECPAFTTQHDCDGNEECSGGQLCCFTLGGTECRPEAECDFDVGSALGSFFQDGGFALPDAGPPVDGGFLDGGFTVVVGVDGGPLDGGFPDGGFNEEGAALDGGFLDGGFVDGGFSGGDALDGGPGPQVDGGSVLDAIQDTLDQGVPVCTSTLFGGCDLFAAEVCCTSDRLTSVDVGFCLPALLCAGDFLP